jgi:hypothetical protein
VSVGPVGQGYGLDPITQRDSPHCFSRSSGDRRFIEWAQFARFMGRPDGRRITRSRSRSAPALRASPCPRSRHHLPTTTAHNQPTETHQDRPTPLRHTPYPDRSKSPHAPRSVQCMIIVVIVLRPPHRPSAHPLPRVKLDLSRPVSSLAVFRHAPNDKQRCRVNRLAISLV